MNEIGLCADRVGHHFKPHKDGMFVMTSDYRTIYTVVIYLNDGFEGTHLSSRECSEESCCVFDAD